MSFLNVAMCFGLPSYLLVTVGYKKLGYDNPSDGFFGIYIALNTLSGHLLTTLNWAEPMAEFAGHTNRLGQFLEVLDDLSESSYAETDAVATDDGVHMANVNIVSPTGDTLLRDLSFEVSAGRNLFIEGPSGCGKSTILRVVRYAHRYAL